MYALNFYVLDKTSELNKAFIQTKASGGGGGGGGDSSPVPRSVLNQFGFTLLSQVTTFAISGITIATIMSVISLQRMEGKSVKQGLSRASLHYKMISTLRNVDKCICNFQSHKINTLKANTAGGDTIILSEFNRISEPWPVCSGSVLAKADLKAGSGLVVESVKVSSIKPTGSPLEYSGNLEVVYKPNSLVRLYKPSVIPMKFSIVDDSTKSPSAKPINLCGANAEDSKRIQEYNDEVSDLISIITGGLSGKETSILAEITRKRGEVTTEINKYKLEVITNLGSLGGSEDSIIKRLENLGGGCDPHVDTSETDSTIGDLPELKCGEGSPVHWVESRGSHASSCAHVGSLIADDEGYGICASGRKSPESGEDWEKINYTYGRLVGSNLNSGGSSVRQRARCVKARKRGSRLKTWTCGVASSYCRGNENVGWSEKHETEWTNLDLVVAWLCRKS